MIQKTINTTEEMLQFYKKIGITPPILISCAIINGKGFTIPIDSWLDRNGEIDRDMLLIPDVLIDDLSIDASKFLQPIFNSIWNACGYTTCPAYDDTNKFIGI